MIVTLHNLTRSLPQQHQQCPMNILQKPRTRLRCNDWEKEKHRRQWDPQPITPWISLSSDHNESWHAKYSTRCVHPHRLFFPHLFCFPCWYCSFFCCRFSAASSTQTHTPHTHPFFSFLEFLTRFIFIALVDFSFCFHLSWIPHFLSYSLSLSLSLSLFLSFFFVSLIDLFKVQLLHYQIRDGL